MVENALFGLELHYVFTIPGIVESTMQSSRHEKMKKTAKKTQETNKRDKRNP